ncbi:MAG: CRISPR-associated endoribonuclease Cas6 [Candidatus Kryptonium sp.]|nr:CRISPR-associated endoribonuclease Cas6 [Candidatus Kryptonium sp.]MCX7761270.1 CRISPR-associated endoribonuclease Cas6 [Candidatus Kryptonium sp.]
MRVEVTLIASKDNKLSLNYNYDVAGLIYRIVGLKSSKFANKIHTKGFRLNGKVFKMFTFSKVFYFEGAYVQERHIFIPQNAEISFLISSPYEEFLKNFAFGLTRVDKIWLGGKDNIYTLRSVEIVFEPEIFQGNPMEVIEVDGVFISPLVVSRVDPLGRTIFLGCYDGEVPYFIRRNLYEKFLAFYKYEPEDEFEFMFKLDYIVKNQWSKLITIKEGREDETKIRCMLAPFKIKGTRRIIKFAWDVGLGEKNSMGFGMWDIAKSTKAKNKVVGG